MKIVKSFEVSVFCYKSAKKSTTENETKNKMEEIFAFGKYISCYLILILLPLVNLIAGKDVRQVMDMSKLVKDQLEKDRLFHVA